MTAGGHIRKNNLMPGQSCAVIKKSTLKLGTIVGEAENMNGPKYEPVYRIRLDNGCEILEFKDRVAPIDSEIHEEVKEKP